MTEVYAERDYAARALNIAREALGPDHPSVARYAETLRLAKLRD